MLHTPARSPIPFVFPSRLLSHPSFLSPGQLHVQLSSMASSCLNIISYTIVYCYHRPPPIIRPPELSLLVPFAAEILHIALHCALLRSLCVSNWDDDVIDRFARRPLKAAAIFNKRAPVRLAESSLRKGARCRRLQLPQTKEERCRPKVSNASGDVRSSEMAKSRERATRSEKFAFCASAHRFQLSHMELNAPSKLLQLPPEVRPCRVQARSLTDAHPGPSTFVLLRDQVLLHTLAYTTPRDCTRVAAVNKLLSVLCSTWTLYRDLLSTLQDLPTSALADFRKPRSCADSQSRS